jgi:hypothetical protein
VTRFVGEWKLQTVVAVTAREGELERGLEAALTEVERIAQHGVTEAELERERRAMESRYDHLLLTRSKITSSSYADAYVAHFLTGAIPAAVEAQVSRARGLLRTIAPEDVAAVAKRWHDGENVVLIAVLPEQAGAEPPSAESLRAVVEAVRGRSVSASGETSVATKTLLAHPPAPGTVTSERRIVEIGVTEWTLSNGGHVFLKPTPFSKELAYDRWYAVQALNKPDPLNNSLSIRMGGGPTSVEEMIANTERGLLVTRFTNVRLVDYDSLLLTGTTADGLWLIERGEITHPIKNFRFRESPVFAFNNLESLGTPVRTLQRMPAIAPAAKVRDFSMTSLADAV